MIYTTLVLFFSLLQSAVKENYIKTIYKTFSQGSNLYSQYYKHQENNKDSLLKFDIDTTYRFEKIIEGENIAHSLFNTNPLIFQGNNFDATTDGRLKDALVSEYFGFPSDTNMKIHLNPTITNNIIDIKLSARSKKVWAQCIIPLVDSIWSLNNGNKIHETGTIGSSSLQDFSIAILYSPPQAGWDTSKTQNAGIIKVYNSKAGSNFNSAPVLDDTVSTNPTDYTDLPDYLFSPPSGILADSVDARSQTGFITSCANLDSDFDLPINDPNFNLNDYPMLNQEIGIGFCKACYINTTDSNGNTSSNTLTNVWQNVLDDWNSSLEIIQPGIPGANSIEQGLGGYAFGDFNQRQYNKWNFSNDASLSSFGIADLQVQCGYDIYEGDHDSRFGLYAKVVLPTGNPICKEHCEYVFSPLIGNGGHLEAGLGFNGLLSFYDKENSSFSIACDAYCMHVFSAREFHSCDKKNEPMSRYALVKELTFDSSVTDIIQADPYAYNNVLKGLGDVNANYINIEIAVHGEAMIDLIYRYKQGEIGIGYAFQGKSKEEFSSCKNECTIDISKFYGYQQASCVDSICFVPINDNVLEIDISTFSTPLNPINGVEGAYIQAKTNSMVSPNGNSGAYTYGVSRQATAQDVFQFKNLNDSCLMKSEILHKIFMHIDYFYDKSEWSPCVGIMGSIGFKNNCNTVISRWDLGGRIGFVF
jgi:hypothetical protein